MGLRERAGRIRNGEFKAPMKGLLARAGQFRARRPMRRGLLARAAALHAEKKNTDANPPVPDIETGEGGLDAVREALDRKILDLTNLFEISKEINGTLDQEQLLHTLLFSAMGQMGVQKICVCAAEGGSEHRLLARKGLDNIDPDSVRFAVDGDLARSFSDSEHPADYEILRSRLSPETAALLESVGAALVAPLVNKQDLVGFLILGKRYGDVPFGPDDREFMGTLASMAAISMENSRLYRRLEQKLNQLSALYDISKIINSTSARDEVLHLISETLSTGFGVVRGALWLHQGDSFRLSRTIGMGTVSVETPEVPIDHPEFQAVLEIGEAAVFDDFRDRPGLNSLLAEDVQPDGGMLLVPLLAAGQHVGVLVVLELDSGETVRKEDRELFSIIASQMAPPVLMAGMVEEAARSVRDPFTPFLERLEAAFARAESFSLSLGIILIRLSGLDAWSSSAGSVVVHDAVGCAGEAVRKTVDEKYEVLRAGSRGYAVLMPGAPVEEQQELRILLEGAVTSVLRSTGAPEGAAVDISLNQIPEEFRDPTAFIFGKGL